MSSRLPDVSPTCSSAPAVESTWSWRRRSSGSSCLYLAYDSDAFSLAGFIEPAYRVGGDNFDYAVERESITLSIADAKGHGLRGSPQRARCDRHSQRPPEGPRESASRPSRQIRLLESSSATRTSSPRSSCGSNTPPAWYALSMPVTRPLCSCATSGYSNYASQRARHSECSQNLATANSHWSCSHRTGSFFLPTACSRLFPTAAASRSELTASSDRGATRELPPPTVVRRATREVAVYRSGELCDDLTVVCFDWRGS